MDGFTAGSYQSFKEELVASFHKLFQIIGIVFLISFVNYLLLFYRNTMDFSMVILYPVVTIKILIALLHRNRKITLQFLWTIKDTE
jgi:hypothetical protein